MARTLKFASAADHFPTAPGQTPDPEQVAAVDTGGRVLVVAGAGAGKTTSVVARVSMLVKEKRVDPRRILAVTFSKDAANEMKERIEKRVGGQAAQSASTIHSFCLRQLKSWGVPVSLENHDTLLSILHEAVLEEFQLSPADGFKLAKTKQSINLWTANRTQIETLQANTMQRVVVDRMVWSLFSAMKALPLTVSSPYDLDRWLAQAKASRPWAQILPFKLRERKSFDAIVRAAKYVRAPSMDFDDLQTCLLYYLDGDDAESAKRRNSITASYDHIICDEGQDLNRVQYDIVQHLIANVQTDDPDKSAWIVGDDWQSIYSFRGSDPNLFITLAKDPAWKVRRIQSNYRSTDAVIQVSNNLANNNKIKIDKDPKPGTERQLTNGLMEVHTPPAEEMGVTTCNIIDRLRKETGETLSGVAVLARTNKDLDVFEQELLERGMPYYRKGGSFFRRSEIATVLAWLRLAMSDHVKTGLGQAVIDACKMPYRGQLTSAAGDKAALELIAASPDPLRMIRSGADPSRASTLALFSAEIERAQDVVARAKTPVDAIQNMLDTVQGSFAPRGSYEGAKRTGRSLRKELLKKLAQKSDEDAVADANAEGEDELHQSYEEASREDSSKLGTAGTLIRMAIQNTDPAKSTVENLIKLLGMVDKMVKAAESNAKKTEEYVDVVGEDGRSRRVIRKAEKTDAVTLATCHAAKGREWNTVFAVLPSTFPRKDLSLDELESERRLAYVQLSRAKKNLIALCPQSDASDPRGPSGVSPFLLEAKIDRHATFIDRPDMVVAEIVFGAWPTDEEIARRIPTAKQRYELPVAAVYTGKTFRGVRVTPVVHNGREYVPFAQVASVAKYNDHVYYAKGGFNSGTSAGGLFRSLSKSPNVAIVSLPDYDSPSWDCEFDLLYLELYRHASEVVEASLTVLGSTEPVVIMPEGKLPTLIMDALPPWARTAWVKSGTKGDDVAVIESPRQDRSINGSVYVSRSRQALTGYVPDSVPTHDKSLNVWFVSDVVRMDYLAALGVTEADITARLPSALREFDVPGAGHEHSAEDSPAETLLVDQIADRQERSKVVSAARKLLIGAPSHADVLHVVQRGDTVVAASAVRPMADSTQFWIGTAQSDVNTAMALLGLVAKSSLGKSLSGVVEPMSEGVHLALKSAGFRPVSLASGGTEWSNARRSSDLPADLVPFDSLYEFIRLPGVLTNPEDEDDELEVTIGREEKDGLESPYYTLTVSGGDFNPDKLRNALADALGCPSTHIQFGLGRSQFKVIR